MDYFPIIKKEFDEVALSFNNTPPIKQVLSGNISVAHYKSLMRQIFHHARENPQLQALATVYFRGRQRKTIKGFYRHAISEIGHDQLALNDLKALGENVDTIPYENPLPSTSALLGFGFYQIYNLNPVGYLGYLFFLEFLPTKFGGIYKEKFMEIGIPEEAMTFLIDHHVIDVGHNKLMEEYENNLVNDENELNSVIYAMKVTGKLYADMIQNAFEQVENPKDWGSSSLEQTLADSQITN